MICPKCGHRFKSPGQQAGGRARVKKGFAIAGQPSPEARKRAWITRRQSRDNTK